MGALAEEGSHSVVRVQALALSNFDHAE